MPRGNYRKRESKKPKKTAKKAVQPAPIYSSTEVEIIRKKKKPREES